MGLVDTIVGKSIEKIFDLILRLVKRKPIRFIDSPTIDEISEHLVRSPLSVDCFFVLIAHVNGKKKGHYYKYTSMMGGDLEEWLLPRLKMTDYVYYEIDDNYRSMLHYIKKHGEMDYVDSPDARPCKITENIRFLGLKRVRYFYLKEVPEKGWLWYAVAGTTQVNERFDSNDHLHHFDMAINKIKNVLKDH